MWGLILVIVQEKPNYLTYCQEQKHRCYYSDSKLFCIFIWIAKSICHDCFASNTPRRLSLQAFQEKSLGLFSSHYGISKCLKEGFSHALSLANCPHAIEFVSIINCSNLQLSDRPSTRYFNMSIYSDLNSLRLW